MQQEYKDQKRRDRCLAQPAVFIAGCTQGARLISGGVKAVLPVARGVNERKDQITEEALA
jgi:hypothetical protein